jgi:hypothetical protein
MEVCLHRVFVQVVSHFIFLSPLVEVVINFFFSIVQVVIDFFVFLGRVSLSELFRS